MKRAERERLIERYLSGMMTLTEEQDFFIEVAADRELRTELKAYQVVESAVRKDREADAGSYAGLRMHMLGVLGGTAAQQSGNGNTSGGQQAVPKPAAQMQTAGAGGSGGMVSIGTLPMKLLMSAVAGMLLTASVVLVRTWEPGMNGGRTIVPAAAARTIDTASIAPSVSDAPEPSNLSDNPDNAEIRTPGPDMPRTTDAAGSTRTRTEQIHAAPLRPELHRESVTRDGDGAASPDYTVTREGTVPRTHGSDSSKSEGPLKINVLIDEPRNDNKR